MSQNIQQVTPFEGPDQITIGNGQGLNINSSGLSTFSSPINPQFSLVLSNLWFVPSITKNLISDSQFCKDNNVYFEFHSSVCLVKSHDTKLFLLEGFVGSDGLYQFPQPFASMPQYKSSSKSFHSSLSNHTAVKISVVNKATCSTEFPVVSSNSTAVVVPVVNTTSCNSVSFAI